ncbi:uncharacterized protein BDZ99DRAFT_70906 [Mytilinidion resinicola]|uniref:Uncharacterized protein n=1 Tax=Mytilinidion resinicola TaxID=574789 RepID=A0A6A6YGX2_9PEZI|nr:uncharacterized protein BDZ99DRAFT_70906 [Mytilinidion resinicola]KAF2807990.1 hypothetical protein BDZ99DRAFT_70906 [Mytilinidion resinicola]
MSTNFLFSLPSELRNNIYEHLLVLQEPIECLTHPWLGQSQLGALTPGLLLVNKAVHREASSLLYAQNRFNLAVPDSELVTAFLDQVGCNNAKHIRHIYLNFPEFGSLDRHDVTIQDGSLRILAKIQRECTNLSTLTTSLNSTNNTELELDELDSPNIAAEALALVDAQFRAILSLQEIIVEVYEEGPSACIRREMESHGWTISVKEQVEELCSNRSFSDIEEMIMAMITIVMIMMITTLTMIVTFGEGRETECWSSVFLHIITV